MTKSLGLYVHIPFCAKKCAYCDFPSFEGSMGLREPYIKALKNEIIQSAQELRHPQVDTLYIGGGTPSLLQSEQMAELLTAIKESFPFAPGYEFSCEANPGMLTPHFLDILSAGGVNRLSLGAQSADPQLLKLLGRQHNWQQVEHAVSMARMAGFDNINIDLMLGIPKQDKSTYASTLQSALDLSPRHLSCYGLIVEEGTPLSSDIQSGRLSLPDEEEERAMYEYTQDSLELAGLHQYEISNFAMIGYECRHNLNCWKRADYLGFGSAAHSLVGGDTRKSNPADIKDYLAGEAPEIQRLTLKEQMFESLMLGLRMQKGLKLDDFLQMHGENFDQVFGAAAKNSVNQGLAEYTQDGYFRLTRQGMDVMNSVLIEFM
ncbi:MAG: radical SAM family heme chaperone HemW [Clostridiales bacterium]|nr:radical SAM family heme chaperone HemW [Clostridiales bacterium]